MTNVSSLFVFAVNIVQHDEDRLSIRSQSLFKDRDAADRELDCDQSPYRIR